MAKRLDITMAEGVAEVSHLGDTVKVNLPDWFRAQEVFYDEDGLLNHCIEQDILLATLQAGMAQHLIEIRAKARPQHLPPEIAGGYEQANKLIKEGMPEKEAVKKTSPNPQRITAEAAQERIDGFKPEARTPGERLLTREQKHARLLKMGFSNKQANAILDLEEQQE